MAVQTNTLNIEETWRVYQEYPNLVKLKECYMNVFRIATQLEEVMSGRWRVAYGYMPAHLDKLKVYVRHCYMLDEDNKVVDPTCMLFYDKRDCGDEYLTLASYNLGDYIGKIIANDFILSLDNCFTDAENKLRDECLQKGIVLLS